MKKILSGIELIAKEREEQLVKHGITIIDDSKNNANGELIDAATYLLTSDPLYWPSNWSQQKREKLDSKSKTEKMTIAAALIAADIDRICYNELLGLL